MSKPSFDVGEALLCAVLSDRCYFPDAPNGGRPLIQTIGSTMYVAIKGTEGWREWVANTNAALIPFEHFKGARVHAGFYGVYKDLLPSIVAAMNQHQPARVVLTGHSMGGAVAAMLGTFLGLHYPTLPLALYTFGCPRPGNPEFHALHDKAFQDSVTFLGDMDIVPHLPGGTLYDRVGRKVWLDSKGRVMGRVRGGWATFMFWLRKWGRSDLGDHNSAEYVRLLQAYQKETVEFP